MRQIVSSTRKAHEQRSTPGSCGDTHMLRTVRQAERALEKARQQAAEERGNGGPESAERERA